MKADNITDYTHPLYKQYACDWQYLIDHYKGGLDFMRGPYLKRHDIEPEYLFNLRKERAVYHNYVARIIDTYIAFIYGNDIMRKDEKNKYDDFLKDCDLKGHPFTGVMKDKIAPYVLDCGHVFAVVDMPRTKKKDMSEQDVIDLGQRPYLRCYLPTNVMDWSLDEFDRPLYVKLREQAPEDTTPDKEKSEDIKYQYRIWYRDKWELYNDNGAIIDSDTHPVGEVPVVPIYCGQYEQAFLGISLVKDIAPINSRIFNWESGIDTQIRTQMHPQLCMWTESKKAEIGVGESMYWKLNPDNNEDAKYITPDVAPLKITRECINEDKDKIYLLALNAQMGGTEVDAPESGISKQIDFYQVNRSLSSIGNSLEQGEKQIFYLYDKWMNIANPGENIQIEYPEEFDLFSLDIKLKEIMDIKLAGDPSKTTKDILWKKIISKLLRREDPETIELALAEIDSGVLEETETRKKIGEALNIGNETEDTVPEAGQTG